MCAKKSNSNSIFSDVAYAYWNDICDIKPLPFEEQKRLIKLAQNGDVEARDKVIESCLRLVMSRAKKYSYNFDTFMDLVQEGNIGLMAAIEHFDEKKGFKFTTYATRWIDKYILRESPRTGNPVYVPENARQVINRILMAQKYFVQQHERTPTVEELSEMLNISQKQVKEMLSYTKPILSLERQCDATFDDEPSCLIDSVEDQTSASPEEYVCSCETRSMLLKFMKEELSEVEFLVLKMRFGFESSNEPLTLKVVAEQCGITTEGARKAEMRAVQKLQKKIMQTGTSRADFLRNF